MAGKLASAGGSGKRRAALQPNNEPNVIPFIDILLVLLIIFMVAAPIPTVDIRVDLPSPNSINNPDPGRRPTFVFLEEDAAGNLTYLVDGNETTRAELGQAVFQAAIGNNSSVAVQDIYAEAIIVFRADQDTLYRNVVGTMGALQEEGFAKVSLFSELADV
jgi:biopolymer transport protein ExbD